MKGKCPNDHINHKVSKRTTCEGSFFLHPWGKQLHAWSLSHKSCSLSLQHTFSSKWEVCREHFANSHFHTRAPNLILSSTVAFCSAHSTKGLVIIGSTWAVWCLLPFTSSGCWIAASAGTSGFCPTVIFLMASALGEGGKRKVGKNMPLKLGEQNVSASCGWFRLAMMMEESLQFKFSGLHSVAY